MLKRLLFAFPACTCWCAAFVSQATAADFTIANGVTQNTTQTIGGANNETGTIEAGGSIIITSGGGNEPAVISQSTGGTIINNGTLSTPAFNSPGIFVDSVNNNTVINNGTITTTDTSSRGILLSTTDNATVTNNGTISTTGDFGHGIFNDAGTGNTIINNRTITTNGANAEGIFSAGDNNTITNNGAVNVLGSGSYGVRITGINSTATNNGTISTADSASFGFTSSVAGNTLVNNGTITTAGANSHAFFAVATAANNSLTNNGRIIANGTGIALLSDANNTTITNAGYARSAGADTAKLNGLNNVLLLKANSTIDGTVLFSGAGTRTLTYDVANTGRAGSVLAITDTVTGSPTSSIINTSTLPTDYRVVQGGNTVAVVTPDQFGGSDQIISQTVNDAGNVVNNRQQLALLGDTTEANSGTQYAASASSINDASNPGEWAVRDRKIVWVEGFGSYQDRGQTSDTSGSQARSGGVLAGVDLPQTDEGIRLGFYAGGFGGSLDVGTFKDIESAGGMAGGYIGKSYGEYYVSIGMNAGFSNNDSDRFTGIDTAKADYTSYFASPSVTVMRPIQKDGYVLVPNATLRYTAQHDNDYNETGSAANQSVDSCTSHSLDARAMLEARLDGKKFDNGSILKTALRAGVQGQTMIGSNETDVTVLGNNLSFNPDGDDDRIDGVLGVNLSLARNENLNLYFDAEANLGFNQGGPSENKGVIGRFGAKWKM